MTAPSAPASLTPADGTITPARPAFSWTAAADAQSGLTGYDLRVDDETVATADAGSTSAVPEDDLDEGSHTWAVAAVDGFGNESASAPRTLLVDSTPPVAPVPLTPAAGAERTAGPGGVHLARRERRPQRAGGLPPRGGRGGQRASAPPRRARACASPPAATPGGSSPSTWPATPRRAPPRSGRPEAGLRGLTLSTPTVVRLGTRPVLRVRLAHGARGVPGPPHRGDGPLLAVRQPAPVRPDRRSPAPDRGAPPPAGPRLPGERPADRRRSQSTRISVTAR